MLQYEVSLTLDTNLALLTCCFAVGTSTMMQGPASMIALHTVHCKHLHITYFLSICSTTNACRCLYQDEVPTVAVDLVLHCRREPLQNCDSKLPNSAEVGWSYPLPVQRQLTSLHACDARSCADACHPLGHVEA